MLFTNIKAQTEHGAMPQLNINISLNKNWKLNTKNEGRIVSQNNQPLLVRYDLALMATRKIGVYQSVGLGGSLLFTSNKLRYRISQQYTFVQSFSSIKLAHRLLTDQTFDNNTLSDARVRYRSTLEIPLSGESVDNNEFYLKTNLEHLLVITDELNYESRISGFLGYNLTDKCKFEAGSDWRLNALTDKNNTNQLWFITAAFINF
ncbi:MAG: DUF2490 domain-containing protein [Bacteroidia bacterium]